MLVKLVKLVRVGKFVGKFVGKVGKRLSTGTN